ncbi:MAG: nucleotidyltransferase family protein [Thermomicrobiales bacterium]
MNDLWTALDRIIATAPDASALRIHGLGQIAAWRMRQRGEPVPPDIERLALGAAYASVTAAPLLQKVVDILQEPVIVLKGPEVAHLYPERALRTYGDLDILVADLPSAEQKLIASGFAELLPGKKVDGHHHDSPLGFGLLALNVELHRDPGWLRWLTPPSDRELFGMAVPSVTGVANAFALPPEQLALYLASHAWRHGPYTSLIHMVDIELLRQQTDPVELHALARRWGIEKVWRSICAMNDWYIYQEGTTPGSVHRWWARHLDDTRERTLMEMFLASWGRGLAAPTLPEQIETVTHDVRFSFTVHSWQSRRQKMRRIALAARRSMRPASQHKYG